MIHSTVRMKMPRRHMAEALEILTSVAERTRILPGCISCRIFHDTQEEQVILLDEIWRSQEDLDGHLRSDEYRNVLLVVEMADEKPDIRFNPLSAASGVETVEKARWRRSDDDVEPHSKQ